MWINPQHPTPTPERLMGHRLSQQTSSGERAVQGTPEEPWRGFQQRDLYPTPPKQLSQYHHILKIDKHPLDGENEEGKWMVTKCLLAMIEITRLSGNERDFATRFLTGHLALCFKRTIWNPNWDLVRMHPLHKTQWNNCLIFSASQFASSDNVRKNLRRKRKGLSAFVYASLIQAKPGWRWSKALDIICSVYK